MHPSLDFLTARVSLISTYWRALTVLLGAQLTATIVLGETEAIEDPIRKRTTWKFVKLCAHLTILGALLIYQINS